MALSAEKVSFAGWTHDGDELALAVAFEGWGAATTFVDIRIWWRA